MLRAARVATIISNFSNRFKISYYSALVEIEVEMGVRGGVRPHVHPFRPYIIARERIYYIESMQSYKIFQLYTGGK